MDIDRHGIMPRLADAMAETIPGLDTEREHLAAAVRHLIATADTQQHRAPWRARIVRALAGYIRRRIA